MIKKPFILSSGSEFKIQRASGCMMVALHNDGVAKPTNEILSPDMMPWFYFELDLKRADYPKTYHLTSIIINQYFEWYNVSVSIFDSWCSYINSDRTEYLNIHDRDVIERSISNYVNSILISEPY